jgi:cell division protein FtsA
LRPHLTCTTEEERRSGVICVDLGAGTTTLSMFSGGRLRLVDAHATGGHHLTFDIARALSTPFDQAERIKTLYGTLDAAASEDQGMVAYTLAGEEEPTLYQTSKSRIRDIITARVADLLKRVADGIERSSVSHLAAHKVVLTGGGSGLPGLVAFAERTLDRPVQIGQPQPLAGVQTTWRMPQFATAIGLTQIAFDPGAGTRRTQSIVRPAAPSTMSRVGQWLRKGF